MPSTAEEHSSSSTYASLFSGGGSDYGDTVDWTPEDDSKPPLPPLSVDDHEDALPLKPYARIILSQGRGARCHTGLRPPVHGCSHEVNSSRIQRGIPSSRKNKGSEAWL